MNNIFILHSGTGNEGEWTVMSLQGALVLRSDSRLPTPWAKSKKTCSRLSFSHHLNVSISGKMPRSIVTLRDSYAVASLQQLNGSDRSLNRDRKGLTAGQGNATAIWGLQSQGDSTGILGVLVKDTRANHSGGRDKKRVGGSTYWKHGQPTASTTAFFWSWLWFVALLKFHKYSNVKNNKINQNKVSEGLSFLSKQTSCQVKLLFLIRHQ